MKMKFTLAVIAILFCFNAQSQITLSNTDMPTIGWNHIVVKDTPVTSINYGPRGANQVYNFGSLTATKRDTVQYLALTNTQTTHYPNATIAITSDHGSTFVLAQTTLTKYDAQGIQGQLGGNTTYANFSPVEDVFHFPTQYGGNYTGNWGFQTTVTGSSVGQPLADSVRVTYTDSYKDTIDGWGKTITPIGAYKSLRQVRHDNTSTVIDAYYFFSWHNISSQNESTVSYNYLAKETKGAVVSFDYDSAGDLLSAKYSTIPPDAPVPHFTDANAGGGLINFTDSTDGYPTTYSWDFGDGVGTSSAQNPSYTYAVNGTYYVCETVTNAGGSNVYCDSVYISGLFLGIAANEVSAVRIYPNPANDYLTIDMRNNNDEAISNYSTLEIFNAIGERVTTVERQSGNVVNVSVANLTTGMYFASVVDSNGVKRMLGKFVK
ncbi:MAG: cell surface protein [Bacteroidota bacterium]|nr:cell surface protein [Bacteroidota bacterium]